MSVSSSPFWSTGESSTHKAATYLFDDINKSDKVSCIIMNVVLGGTGIRRIDILLMFFRSVTTLNLLSLVSYPDIKLISLRLPFVIAVAIICF